MSANVANPRSAGAVSAATSERSRARGRDRRRMLWALPAVLALGYGVAVLANFGSIITAVNMDSDAVVAPVMAQLLHGASSGGHVVLGNHPWYEALLFLRATSGLPAHRQLWDVAPLLWSLLGLAILGWSTWRALGRFSALLAVSALACLGSFGRFAFLTFIWHGLTAWHTIVVGAALVWLTPRLATMSWPRIVAASVALGLLSTAAVASDQLFAVWALVPMIVTALLAAWRGRGRARAQLLVFAVLAALVALLGGAVVAQAMRSAGYVSSPFVVTFAAPGRLVANITLLIEGYTKLAGGDFFGTPISGVGYAVFVSGMLALTALVLVLVEVRRRIALAGPRPRGGDPHVSARFVYLSFWTTCLAATSIAFLLSSAPQTPYDGRYLLGGYVAVGALLPMLARRGLGWRVLVTSGVCVFALSATYQLLDQPFAPGNTFPSPADAKALSRFAQQEKVSLGYGGYWDAADLTWGSDFKVRVFPVWECGAHRLCSFPWVQIASWYQPRPGVRSLLVADSTQPGVKGVDASLGLGPPVARTSIDHLTVYVFAYDIASRLTPASLSAQGRVGFGRIR